MLNPGLGTSAGAGGDGGGRLVSCNNAGLEAPSYVSLSDIRDDGSTGSFLYCRPIPEAVPE